MAYQVQQSENCTDGIGYARNRVRGFVHNLFLVILFSLQFISSSCIKMVIEGCDQRHSFSHNADTNVVCPRRQSEGLIESPGYANGSYNMDYSVHTYMFVNNYTGVPGRVTVKFTDLDLHSHSFVEILRDASRSDIVTKIDWVNNQPIVTSQHCCMIVRFYTKCCGSSKHHRGFKMHYWFVKPCDLFEFSCKNGACLSTTKVCNHVNNCHDGSDEAPDVCFRKFPELQGWHKILMGCGLALLILASYGYSYYKKRQRLKIAMRRQRENTSHQSTDMTAVQPRNAAQPPNYTESEFDMSNVTQYTSLPAAYNFRSLSSTDSRDEDNHMPPAYSSLFEQTPDGAIVEKNPDT